MVADLAAEAASAVKPQYLAILDLRGVSSFTDHFLIASADSARQVRAIAERVEERLAQAGVRRLLVMCPSFVSDCLETLEEIGIRGRETFLAAGGTQLMPLPCLNEHPAWLAALQRMVERFVSAG